MQANCSINGFQCMMKYMSQSELKQPISSETCILYFYHQFEISKSITDIAPMMSGKILAQNSSAPASFIEFAESLRTQSIFLGTSVNKLLPDKTTICSIHNLFSRKYLLCTRVFTASAPSNWNPFQGLNYHNQGSTLAVIFAWYLNDALLVPEIMDRWPISKDKSSFVRTMQNLLQYKSSVPYIIHIQVDVTCVVLPGSLMLLNLSDLH